MSDGVNCQLKSGIEIYVQQFNIILSLCVDLYMCKLS